MSWVRIDDGFADHPKVARAGPLALAAHVRGLCYAARQLTNGYIPMAVADAICVELRALDRRVVPAWLVRHKLWHRAPGGYRIHDYLAYNPHRDDVLKLRALRREFGRRGGQAKTANALTICQDISDEAVRSPSKPPSKLASKTPSKPPSKSLPPSPSPSPETPSPTSPTKDKADLQSVPTNPRPARRNGHEPTPVASILAAQIRQIETVHPELRDDPGLPTPSPDVKQEESNDAV
jgi:hypothetical protein